MFLSIILPCYREAENLPSLFEALQLILDQIPGEKEVIAIDDGSPDGTYQTLKGLQKQYARVRLIRFARNFGKEAALTCGLKEAKGQVVVLLDSDHQHPPGIILEMLERWRQGSKMVYALRRNRNGDRWLRRCFTQIFYAIFHRIAEIDLPSGAGDFRLIDRQVVDAVNQLPERNRFMKGLLTWTGFSSSYVHFDPPERLYGGNSRWSFRHLLTLAADGITAFSTLPLRIWIFCGLMISTLAFCYFLFLLFRTLFFGIDVPGFASLMCGLLFIGGIQLIGLGVLGEYIGRIFLEVKQRPIYIISEEL